MTVPKLALVGVMVSAGPVLVEPVPLSETLNEGVLGSLLAMVTLPETAPAAVGVKVTVACADWPAPIVAGVVSPLTLNAEPVTVSEDTVRLEDPVLLRVRVEVPALPVETVPKLIELGDTESCG